MTWLSLFVALLIEQYKPLSYERVVAGPLARYAAWFEQRLNAGEARVYLGMIHSMDSLAERLSVARKFLPEFGLGAYCGFGRTPPEQLPQVLDDHLKALEIAGRG